MKAIETRYKGYRFRSRLEARWAVFFDAMKVGWEYEKEGFNLGEEGCYLPDFWISPIFYRESPYPEGNPPFPGWWVEIKPTLLTDAEERRCRALALRTRHVVFALAGNIGAETFTSYKWHPRAIQHGGMRKRMDPKEDYIFSSFYLDTFLFYLCSNAAQCADVWPGKKELDFAFDTARSARFEHGEEPRPVFNRTPPRRPGR
jgi:hypothetical protein